MNVVTARTAEETGFAKFNNGNHLCVNIPDGHFTISAVTSSGERITFAFCPYTDGGPADCVDIQHHTSPRKADNGSPVQRVICFTPGSNAFRSGLDDAKPTTLMTVLLR